MCIRDSPRDSRLFFFDLTDPAKRSREDILEVLQVISRFQGYAETCLGLNFNEALQVCETLGLSKGDKSKESKVLDFPPYEKFRKVPVRCFRFDKLPGHDSLCSAVAGKIQDQFLWTHQ